MTVDESLVLFSDVTSKELMPNGNHSLLIKHENEPYKQDDFLHEQSLIVFEGDKSYLFAGYAHRVIVNIVKTGF